MARDVDDWQAAQDQNLGTGDIDADLANFQSGLNQLGVPGAQGLADLAATAFGGTSTTPPPSLSDCVSCLANPSGLSSLLPTAPAGLNINLGAMQGLQSEIASKISNLKGNISGSVGDIKGQLGGLTDKLKLNLSAAAGDLKIPAPNLQDKMKGLMGSIASFNPLAVAQLSDITTTFPNFDVKGTFCKMNDPRFSFNKDVPNLEVVNGEVVEKSAPTKAPTEDPKDVTIAPDAPKVTTSPLSVGLGVITNDIIGSFKKISEGYATNPAKANIEADKLFWETKRKIDAAARSKGYSTAYTQNPEDEAGSAAIKKEERKLDQLKAMATTAPGTPGTQTSTADSFKKLEETNTAEVEVTKSGSTTGDQDKIRVSTSNTKVAGPVAEGITVTSDWPRTFKKLLQLARLVGLDENIDDIFTKPFVFTQIDRGAPVKYWKPGYFRSQLAFEEYVVEWVKGIWSLTNQKVKAIRDTSEDVLQTLLKRDPEKWKLENWILLRGACLLFVRNGLPAGKAVGPEGTFSIVGGKVTVDYAQARRSAVPKPPGSPGFIIIAEDRSRDFYAVSEAPPAWDPSWKSQRSSY